MRGGSVVVVGGGHAGLAAAAFLPIALLTGKLTADAARRDLLFRLPRGRA